MQKSPKQAVRSLEKDHFNGKQLSRRSSVGDLDNEQLHSYLIALHDLLTLEKDNIQNRSTNLYKLPEYFDELDPDEKLRKKLATVREGKSNSYRKPTIMDIQDRVLIEINRAVQEGKPKEEASETEVVEETKENLKTLLDLCKDPDQDPKKFTKVRAENLKTKVRALLVISGLPETVKVMADLLLSTLNADILEKNSQVDSQYAQNYNGARKEMQTGERLGVALPLGNVSRKDIGHRIYPRAKKRADVVVSSVIAGGKVLPKEGTQIDRYRQSMSKRAFQFVFEKGRFIPPYDPVAVGKYDENPLDEKKFQPERFKELVGIYDESEFKFACEMRDRIAAGKQRPIDTRWNGKRIQVIYGGVLTLRGLATIQQHGFSEKAFAYVMGESEEAPSKDEIFPEFKKPSIEDQKDSELGGIYTASGLDFETFCESIRERIIRDYPDKSKHTIRTFWSNDRIITFAVDLDGISEKQWGVLRGSVFTPEAIKFLQEESEEIPKSEKIFRPLREIETGRKNSQRLCNLIARSALSPAQFGYQIRSLLRLQGKTVTTWTNGSILEIRAGREELSTKRIKFLQSILTDRAYQYLMGETDYDSLTPVDTRIFIQIDEESDEHLNQSRFGELIRISGISAEQFAKEMRSRTKQKGSKRKRGWDLAKINIYISNIDRISGHNLELLEKSVLTPQAFQFLIGETEESPAKDQVFQSISQ